MSDFFHRGLAELILLLSPWKLKRSLAEDAGCDYDIPTPCENGYCVKANFICHRCCPGPHIDHSFAYNCIFIYFIIFYYYFCQLGLVEYCVKSPMQELCSIYFPWRPINQTNTYKYRGGQLE
uniref:WAP domain-containing protein n=1 Tax=Anguilla anguilla TaxID=7936 RepID=A0A0E9WUA3_ANGAN